MEKVVWRRWAEFRFGVIGNLLAAPPSERGQLRREFEQLAAKVWVHPTNGTPLTLAVSTIERWYYKAKCNRKDTLASLARQRRRDADRTMIMGDLKSMLDGFYKSHSSWSAKLLADNLAAACRSRDIKVIPSYQTVRRYLRRTGKNRTKRRPAARAGEIIAAHRVESHEVRSFEAEYVGGLWHLDFHVGSRQILTENGLWLAPRMLAIIDDHSRLICHGQWYLTETTRDLVHGFMQALMRRAMPQKLMTDNGAAMVSAEFVNGLKRLGITHDPTLPYSPYQNGKMECFWGQVEGRLMAMLEGEKNLTLDLLNRATHAWLEMEYHRTIHSETGQTPTDRFLNGKSLLRQSPNSDALRDHFRIEDKRVQRRSDGTVTAEGVRFEVPSRYRHLREVHIRYARWDLSKVDLVCPHTGRILTPLMPIDKVKNSDGRRRSREPLEPSPDDGDAAVDGIAPLLSEFMAAYSATGLPPAFIPQT